MKMQTVKLENGKALKLDTTNKLGKGGEGTVYRILSPAAYAKTHCIKIYNDANKALQLERKIKYMSTHIPIAPHFVRLCWPESAVMYRGKFVGYLMPLAFEESRSVLELKSLDFKRRKQLPQSFKTKFDRETVDGLEARLKLSVNIAAAYQTIHQTDKFTVVDMKPDNILATIDAKVSIVDCDSFQVIENGKVLFPASVFTPEYAPPHTKSTPKDIYWDFFSFAVMIYELIFGLHPYTATAKYPYEHATDISSKINEGLFVYGSKQKYLETIQKDNPHQKFKRFPVSIQRLFAQSFDQNSTKVKHRTSLADFGATIYNVLQTKGKKKVLTSIVNTTSSDTTVAYPKQASQIKNTLGWKSLSIHLYVQTALMTTLMILIDTLLQYDDFFSFVGYLIRGAILGVAAGAFWPLLLLFDIEAFWAIGLAAMLSVLIIFRWKYYKSMYRRYFYGVVGIYGTFLTWLLLRYIDIQ